MKKKMKAAMAMLLSVLCCGMMALSSCREDPIEYGDFVCSLYKCGDDEIRLEDLTEQGKAKETIIIPKEVEGRKVFCYTYEYFLGYLGNFNSEKLQSLYIIPNVSIYMIHYEYSPNLKKIVLIGTNNSCITTSYDLEIGATSYEGKNVKIYVSTLKNYSEDITADERGALSIDSMI